MNGERIKKLRVEKNLTLNELSELVGRSASSLSRLENNQTSTLDSEFAIKIANVLDTSVTYLMGATDDPNFPYDNVIQEFTTNDNLRTIIVENNDMEPELPNRSIVKIRPVNTKEKLQIGSFYYIKFNGKKVFRMAIEDYMDGLGFLPNDISERRIAYDPAYVKIIGKVVTVQKIFEDIVEYE